MLELLLAAKDLAITLGTWMEIGFLAYAEIGEVEVRRVGIEWMCWMRAARELIPDRSPVE